MHTAPFLFCIFILSCTQVCSTVPSCVCLFLCFYISIVVCNGKPLVQYESARNRRQVKSSGSMISADDVTAARRSVPFPPVFTTSTCVCHEIRRVQRVRNTRSPPHRCRFSVPDTSSRFVTVLGFHALWMFPFVRVLHQGGMRLTVCALRYSRVESVDRLTE